MLEAGKYEGQKPSSEVLLDSVKNNSQRVQGKKIVWCPNSKYYANLILEFPDGSQGQKRYRLGCNKWVCEVCGDRKAWVLRKKVISMIDGWVAENTRHGFRPSYQVKFLTLTVPGARFREYVGRQRAEQKIKSSLDKLFKALRAQVGWFEYFWVNEPQKDGYPHIHIVLMGKNIAGYDIKRRIDDLWIKRYRMGYTWIKQVRGGSKGLASYLTKYMTKGLRAGRKGNRVFSMSRGLKKYFKFKKPVLCTIVEFGAIEYDLNDNVQYRKIWGVDDMVNDDTYTMLMQFFDDMKKEVSDQRGVFLQLPLPIR